MDLITAIQTIQGIPYIGPWAVYLPPLVLAGSALAMVLPGPSDTSSGAYRVLYAAVALCAINKGHALALASPAAPEKVLSGGVAGTAIDKSVTLMPAAVSPAPAMKGA
jgi:hypothetical protein